MKIKITFKDPDGVSESIDSAVREDVRATTSGLSVDERREIGNTRLEAVREECARWIEYGEYLTIEIDTDAHTATVVSR